MHSTVRLPLRRAASMAALLLLLATTGCQTQADATAAAQQMSTTFRTLQAYYRSLGTLVERTAEAQRAQSYINGIPFDDDTRTQLKDTRAEMRKRADVAETLARLAALFADLANAQAATDAAKAANDLNTELVTLKALKANSDETTALKVAVTAVVNVIKTHDEVKAARLIQPLVTALASFFDAEADLYAAAADSYYITAASNSQALLDRNQVSSSFLYRSSLQPFGLVPEITDSNLRQTSVSDLKVRVANGLADHQQQDKTAATNLSDALHVMRDRVARVADSKPLRATLPPLTLEGVKAWVDEVRSDIGE